MKISLKEVREKTPYATGYGLLKKTWIYEEFRYFCIWFFLNISMNSLQLTIFWGILGLWGIILIGIGNYYSIILGTIMLMFAVFLDECDGAVGRIRENKGDLNRSKICAYVDALNHSIHFSFLFLFLGVGLWRMKDNLWFIYVGGVVSIIYILNGFVKDTLYKTYFNENEDIRTQIIKSKKRGEWEDIIENKSKNFFGKIKFYIYNVIKLNGSLMILIILSIFNLTEVYLYLYAILILLIFVRTIIYTGKIVNLVK